MALWKKFLHGLLDIVFPRDEYAKKIADMEARELRNAIPAPTHSPHPHITSILKYKDPLARSLVWNIKYRGDNDSAQKCAELLYEEILAHIEENSGFHNKSFILIPIPISKERFKERGWNQMELVGDALFKIDGNNSFSYRKDILYKNKHTDSQTKTHNRKEREENLRDCFSIYTNRQISIKKAHIILIDDVYTTGSTIQEARRTLVRAGARSVHAFTIAH